MKSERMVAAFLSLSLGCSYALAPVAGFAKVQVLSETTLLAGEKKVTGQNKLTTHPMVKGLLAAFDRAESALKKEDLNALMQFYAPTYDYHGLKANDVRRIWGEVFEHYKALESLHLFSDIKITQEDNELRAEVTCTGGLYGTDERTGNRITLDSWFREVHYLVKVDGVWRFLGNAGEVPTGAPFASVPHHPLF
ncbi:MAG: hypothetical protein MRJ66_13260 [Nitrospira sp.]|nr:hypothetical protein [Nitrospira sp.]